MNTLKIFWMGFWRLALGLILGIAFAYGVIMLVGTIDIRFTAIVMFTLLFMFFSYAIGETIAAQREQEKARKIAIDYFDKQRQMDMKND